MINNFISDCHFHCKLTNCFFLSGQSECFKKYTMCSRSCVTHTTFSFFFNFSFLNFCLINCSSHENKWEKETVSAWQQSTLFQWIFLCCCCCCCCWICRLSSIVQWTIESNRILYFHGAIVLCVCLLLFLIKNSPNSMREIIRQNKEEDKDDDEKKKHTHIK